jgi:DNA-binding transcriptional LysR family regulator
MARRPELSLKLLHAFAALARELHFGRAAERLGMAQPALSQQIRRMERIVGCLLLDRDTRKVQLTPAGALLRDMAEHVLGETSRGLEQVRRAGRGETGTLTIGFTATTALHELPTIMLAHRARFPDVETTLVELLPDTLVEMLLGSRIDAGLARELLPQAGMTSVPLKYEPYVAVLPSNHPAVEHENEIPLEWLRDEAFILFPRDQSSGNVACILETCAASGFVPRIVQEAPSWQTAVSLVGSGLGVTILPECTSSLALPGVAYRRIDSPRRSQIMLVHRTADKRPLVSHFLETALSTAVADL